MKEKPPDTALASPGGGIIKPETNMQETCGNIKTVLEAMQGSGLSSTAKLVAILESCGISDREELENLIECRPSTLREARAALKIQRQKSSDAGNPAPEIQRSAGNPAQPPEIQRQKSSVPSCAGATNESPSEILIEDKLKLASSREVDISEIMITDIVSWSHGGDRITAANWLSSTVKIFGQTTTSEAYAKLKTDLLSGSVIARKLPAWTAIAQRMKANPPAQPTLAAAGKVVHFRPTDTSGRPIRTTSEVLAMIAAEDAAHAAV